MVIQAFRPLTWTVEHSRLPENLPPNSEQNCSCPEYITLDSEFKSKLDKSEPKIEALSMHKNEPFFGELKKIGKTTGTWQTRFYVLRDNLLYIHKGKDAKLPNHVVFLKGVFAEKTRTLKGLFGFKLYDPSALFKDRELFAATMEERDVWVKRLE